MNNNKRIILKIKRLLWHLNLTDTIITYKLNLKYIKKIQLLFYKNIKTL